MDTDSNEFKYAKKFWTDRIANQGITLSKALTNRNNLLITVQPEINKKLREQPPPDMKISDIKEAVEYIFENWYSVMLGDQEEDNAPKPAKEVPTVSSAKFQRCGDKLYDENDPEQKVPLKNCQEAVKNKAYCEKLTELKKKEEEIHNLIS